MWVCSCLLEKEKNCEEWTNRVKLHAVAIYKTMPMSVWGVTVVWVGRNFRFAEYDLGYVHIGQDVSRQSKKEQKREENEETEIFNE